MATMPEPSGSQTAWQAGWWQPRSSCPRPISAHARKARSSIWWSSTPSACPGPIRHRRRSAAVHQSTGLGCPSLLPGHSRPGSFLTFFITRQGEIWQFVSCDDRAWHAGVSQWRGRDRCNDDSIGIELEGLEGLRFEAPQYQALQRLCEAIAAEYPVHYIAGHEHIAPGRKQDPGPGFDWPRLQQQLGGAPGTRTWELPAPAV